MESVNVNSNESLTWSPEGFPMVVGIDLSIKEIDIPSYPARTGYSRHSIR